MGAHPYTYVVPWQPDITKALQELRADVFARGDYLGAEEGFPTPEEAIQMSEAGTRSTLDITKITAEPAMCAASPLDEDDLDYYFGTTTPTVSQIEEGDKIWSDIDRGTARYVVAYEDGKPAKIVR